jgi:hypothetical protein
MSARYTILERLLFDDQTLKILAEFDAYAQAQPEKRLELTVADFHSLRGTELQFSEHSLRRWLSLRRRFGERQGLYRPKKSCAVLLTAAEQISVIIQ